MGREEVKPKMINRGIAKESRRRGMFKIFVAAD
jgi:hypothetical protein